MYFKGLLLGALLLASISSFAQPSGQTDKPAAQAAKKPAAATHGAAQSAPPSDAGDRIFQQNCSRCHNAPEGFSPRISGTIVRHMRVRASLSQHDAEELLRFFNP
jgi:cytochrome c5